ncbi:MAG TPA: hypothetical protein DCL35_00290 [Candidatus Omnitrophica bacterium]|nr:hypothetical protein [Candidatus Omnitrophota bacterium]
MRRVLPLVFLWLSCAGECLAEKLVEPPKKIHYDSKAFAYNKAWKDDESYIEANLDMDPEKEIIINFMATYKPKEKMADEESRQDYYTRKKKEIPIVQNMAFYQIYDKKPSGYYETVKTITGSDRLGRIFLVKIEQGAPLGIAILSPVGERAIDLEILLWKHGGYSMVFSKIEHTADNDLDSAKDRMIFGSRFVWDPGKNTIETIEN